VKRAPSHVQRFRTIEATLAGLERQIAELSASLTARQHECPLTNDTPAARPRLPVPARASTIFDGDPSRCPDPECRLMRELMLLRSGTAGARRAVESQILLSELQAKRGRKPGSRTRDLVRAAEADLGADAPTKAVLRYIDARLPKGQKAPDESTVRKYRGKSGGN
jgi:hypothetical protein